MQMSSFHNILHLVPSYAIHLQKSQQAQIPTIFHCIDSHPDNVTFMPTQAYRDFKGICFRALLFSMCHDMPLSI